VDSGDHVLARLEGRLVGHAVWGTRWLQPEGSEPLRTAYVDAVASDPDLWGRGVGSAVMRRLAEETAGYQLRGLGTDRPAFYERLGWERWLGPKGVRHPEGTRQGVDLMPEEIVLVLRTPSTPRLDLRSLLTVEPRPGQPW
jgi:GNAT superfamily N-acetyltransferase